MKYFLLLLLLVSALDDTQGKKLLLYKELTEVNRDRVRILTEEMNLLKQQNKHLRVLLKQGNEAKQVLIEEMDTLQQQFSSLSQLYRKKQVTSYTTVAMAIGGVPLGCFIGWGIRDLFLLKKQ